MSPGPAYHARTHAPGGTDPIPGGGHGPWLELNLVNGYTGGPLEYRHAPGSPGADQWELEWRGHIEGPSGVYCGVLPAEDCPPSDKYGITEGEDADSGDGMVVEWYIEAATGYVFITFPICCPDEGGGGDVTEVEPWLVQIVPFLGYSVVAGSWTRNPDSSVIMGGYIYNGDPAGSGDEVTWPVVLSAGTWTIELLHHKASVRGIYTFSIAGSSVGTIDGYNATGQLNQVGSITGITVAASGTTTLSVKCTTRNASATKYGMIISLLSLKRTA